MPWRKVVIATLVAGVLMQAVTVLVWMNPLTTRLILTPEQSIHTRILAPFLVAFIKRLEHRL